MPVLNDLAAEVAAYPTGNVLITIENVGVIAPGVAPGVNINEVWRFKVKVVNNGLLNMKGVTLHINGSNGATVSETAGGPWSFGPLTTASFDVDGGGGSYTTLFYNFKAPAVTKPIGTQLVEAHINTWDANLQNILDGSSQHAITPAGTYSAQVFP